MPTRFYYGPRFIWTPRNNFFADLSMVAVQTGNKPSEPYRAGVVCVSTLAKIELSSFCQEKNEAL